ncbi:hypothetical protein P5673_016753 [Acropora cervicornis]|uniref:Uncharacterized protein n=1 Tax=Acropora cervicornis TaxID=6130 RepID=A0AAD9QFM8_ACRCE|nr:hypothetical protein P5673_016753 [Acropora cervicornis]
MCARRDILKLANWCNESTSRRFDLRSAEPEAFNAVRSCLKSKDDWKIKFRDLCEETYTCLWKSLLRIKKLDEALFAAERGRAQTLSDRLLIQYQLPAPLSAASMDPKETISRLSIEISPVHLKCSLLQVLQEGKEIELFQITLSAIQTPTTYILHGNKSKRPRKAHKSLYWRSAHRPNFQLN